MVTKNKTKLDEDKLKFLCKKRGLSLQELADDVGVARQTISNWCRIGTSKANIFYLVDYFNLDCEDDIVRDDLEVFYE